MIYDLQPFKSEYTPVTSGGMASMEQRDGLIGARRSDGCMLSTRQGDALAADLPQFHVYGITATTCLVQKSWVLARDPKLPGGTALILWPLATTPITIAVTDTLYCKVETDKDDLVTAATLVALAAPQVSVHAQPETTTSLTASPSGGTLGAYYYPVADFTTGANGNIVVANQYQSGGPIMHVPGRNGYGGEFLVNDCDGDPVARLIFKQGELVAPDGDQTIEAGCDGYTSAPP